MIEVLHVVTSLGRGGAERALTDLVVRSDRSRFRHIVCHLGGADDLAGEIALSGTEVLSLGVTPWPHGWLGAARALRKLIDARRPDIVQSVTFDANLATRLALVGRRVPNLSWVVSMEYDPASVRAAGWRMSTNQLRRLLDAASARAVGSRFVACSEAVRASTAARLHIDSRRMTRIYNPVELDNVTARPGEAEAAREALSLAPDEFLFVSIGRLDAAKDHDTLLRAFARLIPAIPGACLLVIGRGRLESRLRERATALGLGDRFRLLAGVPRIAPYLAVASAFAFPSRLEGLPVALIEAMAAGLPCIASAIPPHEELITDGIQGLLFEGGDDAALAVQMRRLVEDPALAAALAEAGRRRALASFTAETILGQWEVLWQETARR